MVVGPNPPIPTAVPTEPVEQVAAAQPTPTGEVPQAPALAVAPQAAPQPAAPPVAQPAAPPPQVSEPGITVTPQEPDAQSLVKDFLDPETYGMLQKQSQGEMSLSEAISLAGLSMANPQMAQQVLAQRHAKAENAKSLLTQLQAQAVQYDKIGRVEEARFRLQTIKENGNIANNLQTTARKYGVGLDAVPPLEDVEAFQAWTQAMNERIELEAQGQIKTAQELETNALKFKIKNNAVGSAIKMIGSGFSPEAAEQHLIAQIVGDGAGSIPEDEARQFAKRNLAIKEAAGMWHDRNKALDEEQHLQNELLRARYDKFRAEIDKIRADLDEPTIENVKAAEDSLKELAKIRNDALARKQSEEGKMNKLQEMLAADYRRGEEASFRKMMIDAQTNIGNLQVEVDSYNPEIRAAAQELNLHRDKLNFRMGYSNLFNETMKNTLQATGMDLIQFFTEITEGGPSGETAIREKFWSDLMYAIQAQYGNLSINDVMDYIEEETAKEAEARTEGAVSIEDPSTILSEQEEMNAELAGRARVDTAREAGDIPTSVEVQEKSFTDQLLETLGYTPKTREITLEGQ